MLPRDSLFYCYVDGRNRPNNKNSDVSWMLTSKTLKENAGGVGGFEGSGGVRASSSSAAAYSPLPPPPLQKKSHLIFAFHMDPTGQLRGVRAPGTPGQLRRRKTRLLCAYALKVTFTSL